METESPVRSWPYSRPEPEVAHRMWPWKRFKQIDRFVVSSGHYQIKILEANSGGPSGEQTPQGSGENEGRKASWEAVVII